MAARYRLTARLESGALAELFRAQVEGSGAEVLVKLFTPQASDAAFAKALAEMSARTHALGNPAALCFDQVGLVRGRLAAVRPFVQGYTLGEGLRRLTTREVVLPPALALFMVAEAAQVVSTAHARGWAHGAVTPGNVLLGFDGQLRVVDFGALEAMRASPALTALIGKGRQAYRAPEVKAPARPSPASDVYSLGAIAYELLTLREVAAARAGGLSTKRDALLAPSRVERRLNPRIDPVIMRALDPSSSRRWPSAVELSEALRGLFSVLGFAPSHNELARFVRDLFPNEVHFAGDGSALPIAEAFELEAVQGAVSPSPIFPGFVEAPRAPFTSTDEVDGPEETTAVDLGEPSVKPAGADVSAHAVTALETWDAPPAPNATPPAALPIKRRTVKIEGRQRFREAVPVPAQAAPRPVETPVEKSIEKPAPAAAPPRVEDAAFDAGDLDPYPQGATPDFDVPAARSSRTEESEAADGVDDAAFDPEDLARPPQAGTSMEWDVSRGNSGRRRKRTWILAAALGGSVGALVASAWVLLNSGPSEPHVVVADAATAQSQGWLTLEADVPAKVFVDGQDTGRQAPVAELPLAAGLHTVLLVYEGATRELVVNLAAGTHEKRTEQFHDLAELKPANKPASKPAPAAATKPSRKKPRRR